MHAKNKAFGSGSRKKKDRIVSLGYTDILDYGCGKGTLRIDGIKQYDPGLPKFDIPPLSADLVVCTDVLEHIEPEFLDNVLAHIESLMLKAGYFTIGILKARKNLPDGRNAHLIIEPAEWWIDKIVGYFNIVEHKKLRDGNRMEERELEVIVVKKPYLS
jgi:hypothetical protein